MYVVYGYRQKKEVSDIGAENLFENMVTFIFSLKLLHKSLLHLGCEIFENSTSSNNFCLKSNKISFQTNQNCIIISLLIYLFILWRIIVLFFSSKSQWVKNMFQKFRIPYSTILLQMGPSKWISQMASSSLAFRRPFLVLRGHMCILSDSEPFGHAWWTVYKSEGVKMMDLHI